MLADLLKDELQKGKFWTHPWGLVRGCTPCSPGCQNCWLVRMSRLHGDDDLLAANKKAFNGTVRCMDSVLSAPLASRKRNPRVWAIWSDFYHENVPNHFRDSAFEAMSRCPSDYFLIVTKRPEIAAQYFSATARRVVTLPNVVHLVTMEDQRRADERGPSAMQLVFMGWTVGALVEPMLSKIKDLPDYIKWCIVGAENAVKPRICDPIWVERLVQECSEKKIPVFVKSIRKNGKLIKAPYPEYRQIIDLQNAL